MIRLPDHIHPEQAVLEKLKIYQEEIDKLPGFSERSAKAKQSFSGKNKIGNKTFDAIKLSLTDMCSGARRCVYCEDSVGDEVEHIHPKDLYPGKCFVWENYVYACGNCNGPKNNKFAVFRDPDGIFIQVNPERNQPAAEPPPGESAMINPRIDDPMKYCMLDLKDTFKFVIIAKKGTKDYERANYTFNEVLRLNDQREFLRKARENAYGSYKARLYKYDTQKHQGADQAKLNKMIDGIKKESHPTVWKEMQRYYNKGILNKVDEELNNLFNTSPEALSW